MKLKLAALTCILSTSSFATGLIPEAVCTGTVDGMELHLSVHVNGDVNYCEDRMDPNVAITMTTIEEDEIETNVILGEMKVSETEAGSVVTVIPRSGIEGASFVYTINGVPGSGEGVLSTPAEPEYEIPAETVTFQCEFPHYHMECHLDL